MPFDKSLYPSEWDTEIRPRILKRAENKCEWCGVPNHCRIWRHPHDDCSRIFTADPEQGRVWYGDKVNEFAVIVVLTIAHVHDSNPMACQDDNLAALCNACHLRHDAKMHAMNAVRTRNKALENAGQMRLPL